MIIKKEDDMPAKCILCGECAIVCPRDAIMISEEETKAGCR
ncbi:MAG: 4Fe-4S binding protein, partial [Desulfobacula sp.]|nr:4Fe-4S binding protein [Desulfobacula sp.]